jgi:hypothetical protein
VDKEIIEPRGVQVDLFGGQPIYPPSTPKRNCSIRREQVVAVRPEGAQNLLG